MTDAELAASIAEQALLMDLRRRGELSGADIGGQHEWDNCAPVAVALAAGLHASRVNGARLLYNTKDTYLPDLLISRKEWAKPVMDCLAAV